jgi:aminoglycoside phosphotransferase (APT) family kinase protein
MVFKRGRRVNIDERPALELAAQYGLPVPRVYDAGESNGEAFIQMDFVEGDRLDLVWPNITEDERRSICQQLRESLTTMRSIPHSSGLIGSCSGGKAQDDRQYTHYSGGPFTDEATFNSSFYFDLLKSTPNQIRTALYQQIRHDHRIVFSHGALAQHNILVKDGRITGLLDWENAGWYPEHWDYIKFFERPCKHRDWKNYAEDIFPELYNDELAHHQAIVRWQNP